MWLAVGVGVALAGWLLMMAAVWATLYDHGGGRGEPGATSGR